MSRTGYEAFLAGKFPAVKMTAGKLERLVRLRKTYSLKASAEMIGVSHVTAIKWLKALPEELRK